MPTAESRANFNQQTSDIDNNVGRLSQGGPFLEIHRRVARSHGILNPYFNFTDKNEPLFTKFSRNNLDVEIGPVGAFPTPDVATFLQAQIASYVKEGTMGDLPADDDQKQESLLAAFSKEFSPSHTLVVVKKPLETGEVLIAGGCLITPGTGDDPVKNLVGSRRATIATLDSLYFDIPQGYDDLAGTPESNIFGVGRFFRLTDDLCDNYQISPADRQRIVAETLIGINAARICLEKTLCRPLRFGLADVNDARIARLVRSYGWRVVSSETRPSESVLQSVLGHHYRFFSEANRRIFVICARANDLNLECVQASQKLGNI